MTLHPDHRLDLADHPRVGALTTLMPDGSPQTSVVWCDEDAGIVRVNCMRGFQKERNMRRDPRVALLCYDPRRPLRSLEVRGTVVEMTEEGAAEHLDAIASSYMGRPARYFGDCIPAAFAATETPVLCRIRPDRVGVLDCEGDAAACDPDGCRPSPGAAEVPDREALSASVLGVPATLTPGPAEDASVPDSHRDLFKRPVVGVLTTLAADGRPRSSLVWVDHDGACPRVNTSLERLKGRDVQRDPRVSLLLVDPDDTSRYVQVRGRVELVRDGAVEHLDALTRRYTRHPAFYGHVYPEGRRAEETRVIMRIHATRVTLDAIHR